MKKDLRVFVQFQTKTGGEDHLLGTFRSYQAEAKYIDLQITGQDKSHTFNCHRLVLSSKSWLFQSLLKENDFQDHDMTSIIIPDMSSNLLVKFANYCYSPLNEEIDSFTQEWFQFLGFAIPASDLKKDEKEIINELEDISFSYTCPFKTCDHMFYNQSDVESHLVSEHKPKTKGILIPSTTSQQSDQKLINSSHNVLLPYKCKFCESAFATETYLQHHLSFHCTICGKIFKSYSKKSQHMDTHQPTNSFVCLVKGCEKTFKTKRYLVQHSKIHQQTRGLQCEICQKVLAGPREMRAHIRVHTGEKPYQCSECPMKFRNRSTCNTHQKLHLNQRPHICPECNHPFIQKGDLRKHIRSKHTLEKPFSCEECHKTFARSDYLLKHTRAHKKQIQQTSNPQEVDQEDDDVNALLSEAMLNDAAADVALNPLEQY